MGMQPLEKRNFFSDPDWIREFACGLKYYHMNDHPLGGNYPGFRSDVINWIDEGVFNEFATNVYEALGLAEDHPTHIEAFFQYCRKEDEPPEWVHRDDLWNKPNVVGLVYLHPDPPPNTGTRLFKWKEGTTEVDAWHDSPWRNDYDVLYTFENEYNKLVMYDPMIHHDSLDCFGTDIHDSRLFIVFFMRID